MSFHVSVTEADIDGAPTHICTLDPITQALRRAVGLDPATWPTATRLDAFTQPSRMFARGPNGQIRCETPKAVKKQLALFDATGDMEPFEFDVPAFEPADDRPSYSYLFLGVRPL